MIAAGRSCYLAVPEHVSLTEVSKNVFGGKFKSRNPIFQNNQGHCLIVPLSHVKCATLLDEDVAAEVAEFKSALAAMFRSNGGEVSTHS